MAKIEDLIVDELRKSKDSATKGTTQEDSDEFDLPECSLEVFEGPDAGKVFPLHGRETVIGRGPKGIVLKDIDVSRIHAVFQIQDEGQVVVHDQGSTNGTYVNGVRVAETTLKSGDEIRIGATKCRFVAKKRVDRSERG